MAKWGVLPIVALLCLSLESSTALSSDPVQAFRQPGTHRGSKRKISPVVLALKREPSSVLSHRNLPGHCAIGKGVPHSSVRHCVGISCCTRGRPNMVVTRAKVSAAGGGGDKNEAVEEMEPPVPLSTWVSLAMLLLVYVSNQWSRNLVYYVQNFDVASTSATAKEFMNIGIGFDETEYGLLASFSFTILFSTFSLLAGRTVDVVSRKTATTVSCLVWSLMTASTAFASSFPEVFALRVVQGSSQAFTTPAAYTLISDLFPAGARGTANSIYAGGVYLGGALASLSLLLNGVIGWRGSHLVIAAAGVFITLLSLAFIREPPRGWGGGVNAEASSTIAKQTRKLESRDVPAGGMKEAATSEGLAEIDQQSFQEALGIVFSSRTAVLLYAASALRFCAGFGIGVWCAPYFRGVYPSFTSEFSVINAFVVGGGGLLSSFLGGVISDKYSPQEPRVRAWVPMAGCLLAVPCWMGVVAGFDFYTSMAFLLAEYIVAECWFGPTVTTLQERLPHSVRGVGQGVFSTLSAFGTLAPPFIGAVMQKGGLELQSVLFWTVPAFYIASAAFFAAAGESVRTDGHKGRTGERPDSAKEKRS